MSKKLFSRFVSALKAESFAFFFFDVQKYVFFTYLNIAIWGGMKPKKSPPARVWNHKIRLRHRARPLFIFLDWYDPKQAYKYLFWVLGVTKKFFCASQMHTCVSSNTFLGVCKSKFASERAWNLKNRHQLAFGIIKSYWGIVRSHCVFSWIHMILTKHTNT